MKINNFQILIKYYLLRQKTITETKSLDNYYDESSTSHKMIQKWFTEFHCDRISTKNGPHLERLIEVTTPKIITKMHIIIRRLTNEVKRYSQYCKHFI